MFNSYKLYYIKVKGIVNFHLFQRPVFSGSHSPIGMVIFNKDLLGSVPIFDDIVPSLFAKQVIIFISQSSFHMDMGSVSMDSMLHEILIGAIDVSTTLKQSLDRFSGIIVLKASLINSIRALCTHNHIIHHLCP